MRGAKQLLLLGVFVLLARCQQKPTVSMSPKFSPIFTGDLVRLQCDNSGESVNWYFNNQQMQTGNTLTIVVANSEHSGSYQCESDGQRSDNFPINVHGYIPRALLTIKTGHPVMRAGDSVILQLSNDGGLEGWTCYSHKGQRTRFKKLGLNRDILSVDLPTAELKIPETIFWCASKTERSNQIVIRMSDKAVSLEMYPQAAVTGDSLTLRCLVWGTNHISHSVFYKDNEILSNSNNPVYQIPNVTESTAGKYKCNATYKYKADSTGPPYRVVSDEQDVFVQVGHVRPVLSEKMGLSCSCSSCPSVDSYHWYRKNDVGVPVTLKDYTGGFIMPKEPGTYACRATWKNGSSFFSNSYQYEPPIKATAIIVLIVLVILGLVILAIAACLYRRRSNRDTTGPLYEDVALKTREKGDQNYEELQRRGQKEDEYDLLNPDTQPKEKKEGEYEGLKKSEMKDGVYHTLGMEGTSGGAAGTYQALKKEGTEAAVYHTLGREGAEGGAGAYEALKKGGVEAAVYHTLGKEGAEGGAGAYEELKKGGVKAEVYHTLEMKGTGGGEGGYEAVGKEREQEKE